VDLEKKKKVQPPTQKLVLFEDLGVLWRLKKFIFPEKKKSLGENAPVL